MTEAMATRPSSRISGRWLLDQLDEHAQAGAAGMVVGQIGHDFNNTLMAIRASALFAEQDLEAGLDIAPRLAMIAAAVERSAVLADHLVALAGHCASRDAPVDLNHLACGLAPTIGRLISSRVSLEMPAAGGPVMVQGDAAQLERVIVELCVNAADAMPDAGNIRIEARLLQGEPEDAGNGRTWAELTVADTGSGVDEDVRARLFEPFLSSKRQRMGLGLAVINAIVAQHGGSVQVASVPQLGTRVLVLLPAATPWTGL